MANIGSLSTLTTSISQLFSSSAKKKTASAEEILAQQQAATAQKAEDSQQTSAAFLKLAKMSPAERWRESFLKDHNLTEDDLKQMTPTQREQVEEQIKQFVKQKLGLANSDKTGQLVDITA